MRNTLLLLLVLGLVSCGKPIEPDLNREYSEIKFYSYKTKEELNATLEVIHHEGMAIWSPQDEKCEVHFIEPRFTDDQNTLTLGHEVLHCIRGSYHK